MALSEDMHNALAEVMKHQAQVHRAKAAVVKAEREEEESLAKLAQLARQRDVSRDLTPGAIALVARAKALPPRTIPTGVQMVGSLRTRILTLMAASPDQVFTPALLAPLIGSTNRDSIRNTLLVLAVKGKIEKCGLGQYKGRLQEGPPPRC